MAYVHQVSFFIAPDQMEQLQIGESLERVLGYLRVLLPNEPGYITTRSMFSIDRAESVQLLFQSVWNTWEQLRDHHESRLAEERVLEDFQPHVELKDLTVRLFQEVE